MAVRQKVRHPMFRTQVLDERWRLRHSVVFHPLADEAFVATSNVIVERVTRSVDGLLHTADYLNLVNGSPEDPVTAVERSKTDPICQALGFVWWLRDQLQDLQLNLDMKTIDGVQDQWQSAYDAGFAELLEADELERFQRAFERARAIALTLLGELYISAGNAAQAAIQ